MSLEDGDIIMSGTPKGVNTYKVNDKFTGKIYDKDKLLIESTWQVVSWWNKSYWMITRQNIKLLSNLSFLIDWFKALISI